MKVTPITNNNQNFTFGSGFKKKQLQLTAEAANNLRQRFISEKGVSKALVAMIPVSGLIYAKQFLFGGNCDSLVKLHEEVNKNSGNIQTANKVVTALQRIDVIKPNSSMPKLSQLKNIAADTTF